MNNITSVFKGLNRIEHDERETRQHRGKTQLPLHMLQISLVPRLSTIHLDRFQFLCTGNDRKLDNGEAWE